MKRKPQSRLLKKSLTKQRNKKARHRINLMIRCLILVEKVYVSCLLFVIRTAAAATLRAARAAVGTADTFFAALFCFIDIACGKAYNHHYNCNYNQISHNKHSLQFHFSIISSECIISFKLFVRVNAQVHNNSCHSENCYKTANKA